MSEEHHPRFSRSTRKSFGQFLLKRNMRSKSSSKSQEERRRPRPKSCATLADVKACTSKTEVSTSQDMKEQEMIKRLNKGGVSREGRALSRCLECHKRAIERNVSVAPSDSDDEAEEDQETENCQSQAEVFGAVFCPEHQQSSTLTLKAAESIVGNGTTSCQTNSHQEGDLDPYQRCSKIFSEDVEKLVALTLHAADEKASEESKREEIVAALAQIRALRTAVNINTSFIILSSLSQ